MTIVNLGGCRLREAEPRELIDTIKRLLGDVRIAVIADSEDLDDVSEGFARGVHGYIPTATRPEVALPALSFILSGGSYFPPSILFSAGRRNLRIRAGVVRRNAGETQSCDWLSPAQSRIIELLRSGRSNKAIARDLDICEATVKAQLRMIMRRLSLGSRTQVAIYFANQKASEENVATTTDGAGLSEPACEALGNASDEGVVARMWRADVGELNGAAVASAPATPTLRRQPGSLHRPA